MNFFSYILLGAFVMCALGAIIIKLRNHDADSDWIIDCYAHIVRLVREAEHIWADAPKAGAEKKEWVLSKMVDFIADKNSMTVVSQMIDNTVKWLNKVGW